jgi:hypothetical protein
MERACHNPIRRVESFFNAIAMVAVNVNVEDSRVNAEEVENGKDNVIYIAEAGGFAFLGMVQATCPVDGNVCWVGSKGAGGSCRTQSVWLEENIKIRTERATGRYGTELEYSLECGIVVSYKDYRLWTLNGNPYKFGYVQRVPP